MDITNTDVAIANAKTKIEEARSFLHRLAKHLDENGMPGQAGNCTIQAGRLQEAGVCLAFVERKRMGE